MRWGQFFGCALMLAVPSVAHADWQYTRWGMSREEIIAASKGAAVDKPFDASTIDPMLLNHLAEIKADAPSLHAPYESGNRHFDADFTLKGGKLMRVSLNGIGGAECYRLSADLDALYGKPFEHRAGSDTYEWHDIDKNNRVMFTIMRGGSCSIWYEQLKSEEINGL